MSFMFEDLEVYRKAMFLAKKIFLLKREIKDRAMADQLSRAVLSIPLNIAEGQGRLHLKEKRQFYHTARGSLFECVPLSDLCCQMGFFGQKDFDSIYEAMNEISRMLMGLIKSLDRMGGEGKIVDSGK